jgi:hypothetical protein
MSLLVYLGGGALLAAALRWWRPSLPWGWIGAYWLLAGALFAAPLLSPAVQVPTDIAYQLRPWLEMVEGPVRPANKLLSDVPLQMVPFRQLVRDRLLHLEAPLWAGELGAGQALLGNAQAAPFSPLGLLTLPLPPVRALPVMAALKLFLSLLLTDALLSALGAGRAGAVFAALAYSFSVYSLCWALYPIGMAAAWLPGVFLGLVLLRRGERGAAAGLVACATGMALSGHPESLAHTALVGGLAAALLLAAPRRTPSVAAGGRWRFLGRLALAGAVTAGLTAPVLLPVVEAVAGSIRAAQLAVQISGVQPLPFAAANLRVLADPLVYGSPRGGSWDGPWNYNELCSGYAGLLSLALAVAAAAALRGRLLALLAGGAALAAAAFAIPPFSPLLILLPPFDHVANGRLRLFWVLALAAAAGLGLERLAARRGGRLAAALAALAGALVLAAIGPPPDGTPWGRAWWLAAAGGCVLTALAFGVGAMRRDAGLPPGSGPPGNLVAQGGAARLLAAAPRWLPWLAVLCLAADLGLLEARFLPVLDPRLDLAAPPAVARVAAELQHAVEPFRVIGAGADLIPNLSALYGLWDPRSDDPMQLATASLVIGRALRPGYRLGQPMVLVRRPFPIEFLSFMSVRYLIGRHRQDLDDPWQEVADEQGGRIWRNTAALPLFFMPGAWRRVGTPREALFATVAAHDFAATALLESTESSGDKENTANGPSATRAEAAGGAASGWHGPQRGEVRILRRSANGFVLDVASPTGGLVVSSVAWSPSWQLAIDGAVAPPLRTNAAFLGFQVPAGRHRVTLDFSPAGWRWGLRLCAATVAALLAAGALREVRRRRGVVARLEVMGCVTGGP